MNCNRVFLRYSLLYYYHNFFIPVDRHTVVHVHDAFGDVFNDVSGDTIRHW